MAEAFYRANHSPRAPSVSSSPVGSPIRDGAWTFAVPKLEAVYTSFIVVSWSAPEQIGEKSEGINDSSTRWKYAIEWSPSGSKEWTQMETPYSHACLPLDFPGLVQCYSVRLTALLLSNSAEKAGAEPLLRLQSMAALKVNTPDNKALLWLACERRRAPYPRVIFDAFVGVTNLRAPVDSLLETEENFGEAFIDPPKYLGRCPVWRAQFSVVQVRYRRPALCSPVPTQAVIFMLLNNAPAHIDDPQLTAQGLLEMLGDGGREPASMVFCGLGADGIMASKAAYRVVAAILNKVASAETAEMSNDWLRRCQRVYGVFFNCPREEFFADRLVLSGTSLYSGQLLYVNIPRNSPLLFMSGEALPPQKARPAPTPRAEHDSCLLGVVCNMEVNGISGCVEAQFSPSAYNDRSEDDMKLVLDLDGPIMECCGGFLNGMLLTIASAITGLTLSETAGRYSPIIHNVTGKVVDGVVLSVSIEGAGLDYTPRVVVGIRAPSTQVEENGEPTPRVDDFTMFEAVVVGAATRNNLEAELSLVQLFPFLNPAVEPSLNFAVIVSTMFGMASVDVCHVEIPQDIVQLTGTGPWQAKGSPTRLITDAVQVEPLCATFIKDYVVPSATTRCLAALESAANILHQNSSFYKRTVLTKPPDSVSFFQRVANAAAKATSSQVNTPLPLAKHDDVQTLGSILVNAVRGAGVAALKTWALRISSLLPWAVDEGAYRTKLLDLLSIFIARNGAFFDGIVGPPQDLSEASQSQKTPSSSPSPRLSSPKVASPMNSPRNPCGFKWQDAAGRHVFSLPISTLELILVSEVVRYIRQVAGRKDIQVEHMFHEVIPFGEFYRHFFPLLCPTASHGIFGEKHPGFQKGRSGWKRGQSRPAFFNTSDSFEVFVEIAAVWSCCLLHYLRASHTFTKIYTIGGFDGSGRTAITNLAKQIVRSRALDTSKNPNREDPVLVRDAPSPTLVTMACEAKADIVHFVVVEAEDIVKAATKIADRASVRASRVFVVVNKLDEWLASPEGEKCEGENNQELMHNAEKALIQFAQENSKVKVAGVLAIAAAPTKQSLEKRKRIGDVTELVQLLSDRAVAALSEAIDT